MIIYCAADRKYFDLYFDLWEKQTSKIYPELRRHIALHNPTDEAKQKCYDNSIDFNDITEWFPENPTKNHFYLLRWLYLPFLYQQNILETQINCLHHFLKLSLTTLKTLTTLTTLLSSLSLIMI